jgi:subtilisin family serine protease
MRLVSTSFISLILMGIVSSAAFATDFRAGEVIVKYKTGSVRTRLGMNSLYMAAGVKNVRRFSGVEHLILNDNIKVQDAIAALKKNPDVEYAEPNYIIRLQPVHVAAEVPSLKVLGTPCTIPGVWPPGCDNSGAQPSGRPDLLPAPADVNPPVADPDLAQAWGMSKIAATEAWNTFRGSRDFIVADIDTGIDYNHEDLQFNVWRNPNPSDKSDIAGYDFIHDDGLPFDDQGHGTHTAGTIGAVGGNGVGVSGVSQRVSLMALKFLSADGSGDMAGAVKAIDYAIAHGAKVLSNSWGGPKDSAGQTLLDAVNRADAAGVLFVAAAGNGDQFGNGQDNDNADQAAYPAGYNTENMIAVAATDSNDAIAAFSNYGATTVHLAAPGVDVYSTLPGNKYGKESGTSMACPHVSGAAALLWAKNPSWDYKKVKEVLMSSVDKLDALSGKTVSGGRLNLLNALRSRE